MYDVRSTLPTGYLCTLTTRLHLLRCCLLHPAQVQWCSIEACVLRRAEKGAVSVYGYTTEPQYRTNATTMPCRPGQMPSTKSGSPQLRWHRGIVAPCDRESHHTDTLSGPIPRTTLHCPDSTCTPLQYAALILTMIHYAEQCKRLGISTSTAGPHLSLPSRWLACQSLLAPWLGARFDFPASKLPLWPPVWPIGLPGSSVPRPALSAAGFLPVCSSRAPRWCTIRLYVDGGNPITKAQRVSFGLLPCGCCVAAVRRLPVLTLWFVI